MSKKFVRVFLLSCASCAISGIAGFLILGIYGLILGAAVGLLLRPGIKRVAWFLVTFYGGQGEPEQPVHFWGFCRKRDSKSTGSATADSEKNAAQ